MQKNYIITFIVSLSFLLLSHSIHAQLVITSGGTATALAQAIVGPGITISNATITGNVASYGTFTAAGTNLGIPAGIILATGNATNAIGPNNSASSGTAYSTSLTDGNLVALQPGATNDVCMLQFDLVPQCSTLSIHYVFGSEEYPEWVSSTFNDAFGFFLSGANPLGGTYNNINIATVPTTGQYVSIDNVNATTNNAYYVNNTGGATIQYDGMTVPMVATASVVPCSTYHLKIIIADAGDWSYDSGVFFNSGGLNCPQQQILALNMSTTPSSCTGNTGTATVNVSGGIGPFTYSWSTGQTGTTSISGLAVGNYNVTVNDLNACTPPILQNFAINGPNVPTGSAAVTDVTCNGGSDGSVVLTALTGIPSFQFSFNGSPFNSNNIFNGLSAGTYNAVVQAGNGCTNTFPVTVGQAAALTAQGLVLADVSCNGGSNGAASVTPGGGSGSYTYSWSNSQLTQNANNLSFGTYQVTVFDANVANCSTSTAVNIAQPLPLSVSTQAITPVSCNGGNDGSLQAVGNGGSGTYLYSWLTNPVQTTAVATNLSAGTYTVFVIDANDVSCMTSTTTTITEPSPLVANGTLVSPVTCFGGNNGVASVNASGGNNSYNYSWLTTPVQTTPTATNLAAGTYTVFVMDAMSALNCITSTSVTVTEPTALAINLNAITDVSCNGGANGAIDISATGGSGAYLYSWVTNPSQSNSTATNLVAGTYSIFVSDSNDINCQTTQSFTVNQPQVLALQTNLLADADCFGAANGSADVVAVGGSGNYTYSWLTNPVQNTATAINLAAGTQTVYVLDSNDTTCLTSANVLISQPTALNIVLDTMIAVTCFGGSDGSALVQANGGSGNYSYSWTTNPTQISDSAINLSAGNYTVFVQDANSMVACVASLLVNVTEPSPLQANTNVLANVDCAGAANGSANVIASGGSGNYSYSWATSPAQLADTASLLPMGTYTVFVNDAATVNCSTTAIVSITEPAPLNVDAVVVSNVTCHGGSNGAINAIVTGGSGNYTYNWVNLLANTPNISSISAGPYHVIIVDTSATVPCSATDTVSVTEPLALEISLNNISNVTCFNGSNGSITVNPSGGSGAYTYSWTSSPSQSTATATGLSAGSYTVYLMDSNDLSCDTSQTFMVNQVPLLGGNTTVNAHVSCYGGSDGSAIIVGFGGSGSYLYSWLTNPVQTTSIATNLSFGVYSVYVIDAADTNCVLLAANLPVQQASPLVITLTQMNPVTCFGGSDGSATITASGGNASYNYSWATNPPQLTNTATGLSAGNYTVYIFDATLTNVVCSTSLVVNITQATPLSAVATMTAPVTCFAGANGAATVVGSGGSGNYTYSWLTSPPQLTQNATGLSQGTYTVFVGDLNSTNCFADTTVTITQPTVLNGSVTVINHVSCNGGTNGSATVNNPSGGSGAYNYSWATIPAQLTQTATNLSANTYTVYIYDANDVNCFITKTVTITEPAALGAVANVIQNVSCFGGNNGSASVTPSGGNGNYLYSWLTTPVKTTATVSGLAAGTYTVWVIAANDLTCKTSTTVTITQPADIVVSLSNSTNVSCKSGNDGSATVNAVGGSGTYTYTWNSTPLQFGATATNLTANNYTVKVDDGNCFKTFVVQITQPTALTLAIQATNPLCNGDINGTATANVAGGTANYQYSWTTSPAQSTAAITNLSAGTYTCYITDAKGCTIDKSVTLINPMALSGIPSQNDVKCFGLATGNAHIAMSGGVSPYSYSWANTASTSATAAQLPAGNYTVYVMDAKGCTYSQNYTLTQPASALSISSSHTDASCYGAKDATLSVSASGATPPYVYTWNTNPLSFTSTVMNVGAGTYAVTVKDNNGCFATSQETIGQPSKILVSLDEKENAYCNLANGLIGVNAVGGNGNYSYSWHTNPPVLTANLTSIPEGTYDITVTDIRGCTGAQSFSISNTPPPVAAFSSTPTNAEPIVLSNAQFFFQNETQGQTMGYSWNFGDGYSSAATNPNHTFNEVGTFTVVLYAIDPHNTCPDSTSITYVIIPTGDIFAPNAFSPNGDGSNDVFYFGGNGIVSLGATIYDRWGKIVYQLQGFTETWDGRNLDGKELPEGAYTYKVKAVMNDGTVFERGGTITLLR